MPAAIHTDRFRDGTEGHAGKNGANGRVNLRLREPADLAATGRTGWLFAFCPGEGLEIGLSRCKIGGHALEPGKGLG